MDAAAHIPLSAAPGMREGGERNARRGRLRWGAILATTLFHAAIIAVFLLRWPFLVAPPPLKPPIAVTLVTLPSPAALPPTQARPPAPAPPRELRSGLDQETTAPPEAEAKGPDAAPKPQPEKDAAQASGPGAPQLKQPTAPQTRPMKEALRETAPQPAKRGSVDAAPGESEKEGDPYLNHVWAMIEQHRFYPADAVGSLGLRLEGTTIFLIALSPQGALQGMRLERSSGAPVLDEAARKMIEQAAPFPPLPGYFPREGVTLSVTIHLFPAAS